MALTIWPGAYLDRYETYNIEFDGAVEAIESTDLVLRNNIVAGCERAGYHLPGQDCSTPMSDQWVGNEAHSCLIGVANFPSDHAVSTQCFMWAGFTVWKNADWGLFIDNLASQIVTNLLSVENGVGYFPFVVGPSAVSHTLADKTVEVRNSTFVGRSVVMSYCHHFPWPSHFSLSFCLFWSPSRLFPLQSHLPFKLFLLFILVLPSSSILAPFLMSHQLSYCVIELHCFSNPLQTK